MGKVNHTTIRNEKLFCLNCGGQHHINLPIAVTELNKKIKAFNQLHHDCDKTWTEPNADQTLSVKDRANWWIVNGETGLSSKTIYATCMGIKGVPINYPHDPADFSRCYKLLKAIPEWKSVKYMNLLSRISPVWESLVENWDKLTEMYEQNVREEWKNYDKIGMYELMQDIINKARNKTN